MSFAFFLKRMNSCKTYQLCSNSSHRETCACSFRKGLEKHRGSIITTAERLCSLQLLRTVSGVEFFGTHSFGVTNEIPPQNVLQSLPHVD
jgi:hypothetical protein